MIQSLTGFRDVFPPESTRMARFAENARRRFALYGYVELRLPTIEYEELYHKSTGETTDIVEKEMFALSDASGRKMALRPEGTPGLVRAYLEADLHKKGGPKKFFYVGQMFRKERPQAGRFREFEQIGIEYLGNPHPAADAEAISLLLEVLEEAGIKRVQLLLNTMGCKAPDCRPRYRDKLLAHLHDHRSRLCKNCQSRIDRNPLRALDCKQDGEHLRTHAPRLAPCSGCQSHFAGVKGLLKADRIEFKEDPHLVRGLDYYTRTVFETRAEGLGSQDAVCGGGRYDDLVESMGGPSMPAVGWALGTDRTLMASATPGQDKPVSGVFVASLGADEAAYKLLQDLRRDKVQADGGLFEKSLRAQMKEADRLAVRYVIIIGEDEVRSGNLTVKDLSDSTQIQLPQAELSAYLRKSLEEPR